MMIQSQMNIQLNKKGLETSRGSKVTRDLVKSVFDAVKLPCSLSTRPKAPTIVGEEALHCQ